MVLYVRDDILNGGFNKVRSMKLNLYIKLFLNDFELYK